MSSFWKNFAVFFGSAMGVYVVRLLQMLLQVSYWWFG